MKRLVFIGDSLTEWFDWQKRFPAYKVKNLGVSGEPVEGLLERRELVRLVVENTDCIFLMTGINNVLSERYDITASYGEIVRNFTTWWKNSKIVVQSLLPVDMPWINNDMVRDINRRLAGIAREFGAEYLDVHGAFVDTKGNVKAGLLSDDGVHLSDKGYEVWAGEIDKFLKESGGPG